VKLLGYREISRTILTSSRRWTQCWTSFGRWRLRSRSSKFPACWTTLDVN